MSVRTSRTWGKALSGASRETAESFLTAAARLESEVPDHHYELGLLYLDTDRPALALAAFEGVLACPRANPSRPCGASESRRER